MVNVSSNANNGTNAGRFILNSNNDSSNANRKNVVMENNCGAKTQKN